MDLAQFLPEKFKKIPCHMDYEGQKRAEQYFQVIIVLFGAVGFGWGYICQQFSQTMYILLAGFALSCILTLPPWPMFRRKPMQWQKARPETSEDAGKDSGSSSSQTTQKSKKKK